MPARLILRTPVHDGFARLAGGEIGGEIGGENGSTEPFSLCRTRLVLRHGGAAACARPPLW
ncbi:hypothetical protein DF3PA_260005 [Candidatus Defluviicoccus seviourii]|uniref:Uncharacterized protein n=1 Tax=Candidatus Defluviicoccus seviourii TaxID=2565273 RepID=A0A564WET7_9PROT|nr:hypothetical protein DF3PA_260005 [Candidatus Defluviicoccus seviourii]